MQTTGTPQTTPIPEHADFQYSSVELSPDSAFAGGCAWIEGKIVPGSEARISIFDEGFRFSETTYTSIGVWNGRLFRAEDHLDRFLDGVNRMGMQSPYSKEKIHEICLDVVSASELREAFLLVCLTSGAPPLGGMPYVKVEAQLYVYVIPYRWVFSPELQMQGARLTIARSVTRVPSSAVDATIKNFSWRDLMVAKREATSRGYDSSILLSTEGVLTEGPGFNVLMIKDGVVTTPARDCLLGITRRTALELLEGYGLQSAERDITEEELKSADEVFLSTTAGGITPVIEVDGQPISGGVPGPITTRLRAEYWQMVSTENELTTAVTY